MNTELVTKMFNVLKEETSNKHIDQVEMFKIVRIMEQYVDGIPIQVRLPNCDVWEDVVPYTIPIDLFRLSCLDYVFRVKPS